MIKALARFARPIYFAYLGFILAVLYFPFVIMAILSFQAVNLPNTAMWASFSAIILPPCSVHWC